jgi:hypothetical protein
MTLDPVLASALRVFFGGMFAVAAIHKVIDFRAFSSVVQRYTYGSPLANARAAIILGGFLIAAELAVAFACALGDARVAATGLATLLLAYAGAMYGNLRRGHVLLDCGCSWGDRRQPVTRALVVRNIALAGAASLLAVPHAARALSALDLVSIMATVACAAALYSGVNQLLAVQGTLEEAR